MKCFHNAEWNISIKIYRQIQYGFTSFLCHFYVISLLFLPLFWFYSHKFALFLDLFQLFCDEIFEKIFITALLFVYQNVRVFSALFVH